VSSLGLARVLRVSGGNAVHGLISWDMYVGVNPNVVSFFVRIVV
jgi:hypothetical protein